MVENVSVVPDGTQIARQLAHPALKCWAIFAGPWRDELNHRSIFERGLAEDQVSTSAAMAWASWSAAARERAISARAECQSFKR